LTLFLNLCLDKYFFAKTLVNSIILNFFKNYSGQQWKQVQDDAELRVNI